MDSGGNGNKETWEQVVRELWVEEQGCGRVVERRRCTTRHSSKGDREGSGPMDSGVSEVCPEGGK